MRWILKTLMAMIPALVLCGICVMAWGIHAYKEPGPLREQKIVMVEKGAGVSSIAAHFQQEGVIAIPLLFKVAARLTHNHTRLRAGEYEFPPRISMKEVMDKLVAGDVYQRRFTIPEGLTSWQVVQVLNNIPELEGEVDSIPAEGSLLPETYSYMRGDTRQSKIEEMQKAMKDTLESLWFDRPKDAPLLSQAEAVILASIVEKETAVPEERRRIAGVFINRLKNGMKLQTDPTVIYAITGGEIQDAGQGPLGRRLLSKDLQFESPYNTYKYPGLPPGPIANPGRAALEAVINPEDNHYLYFVANGSGGHVFAETLEEHNANVVKWRKIRNSDKN